MDRVPTALHSRIGLVAGPLVCAGILIAPIPEGMTVEGHRAAAIAAMMVVLWLTEAIPLAATALIPIALFPLFGVLKGTVVTMEYGNANIFLFAGGFFIAMAMQKWNLHERIALNVVVRAGSDLRRLVGGFMVAGAGLSMWISNTATALMMVPIALAVIDEMEKSLDPAKARAFSTCLLLSIAYSCSIGGVATLIGTPPNLVLAAQYSEMFPEEKAIGFVQWMMVGVPFVVIFLPIVWLLLTRLLFPLGTVSGGLALDKLQDRLKALGAMSRGEKTVLTVACMTGFCWMFRADIELGAFLTIPGWSNLFPRPELIHDSTVAIFFAVVLFIIPVDLKKGEFALDWEWAQRIPWGILILFGGGLALAKAFRETQLVEWLGGHLDMLSGTPPIVTILVIALTLTFVTEMTSNTATTTIMMPILGGAAAPVLGVHPLLLMIPAAMSASCAFMMPVATPPNAIVFGGGRFSIPDMAKAGFVINLVGAILVTAMTYFIALPVFGIS